MLKFSGFADLTSCRDGLRTRVALLGRATRAACLCKGKLPEQPQVNTRRPMKDKGHLASCWPKGGEHHEFSCAMSGQARLTLRDTSACSPKQLGMSSGYGDGVDTEAGMLPGISRKRSIRSNPYWFTEFCNSQCLSHFAAPFIVVRAETSVAESCDRKTTLTLVTETDKFEKGTKTRQPTRGSEATQAPLAPRTGLPSSF